ncbi:MAG TPA: hypothetical protein VJX47_12345 [Candidatus Sulfotelmatobacter sp.]|nr:hypothetical protein [Candidatus Sulfotelmatobacter sp.]
MDGPTQFAAKALVPVAVAVCFALARKYLKPQARLSETQLSALDGRFEQIKWVVGVSMIAVANLFAWATHHLLVSLNRYLAAGDGPETALRLWPQTAIWWFFPGFGAVALCWEITLKLWSAFGQRGTARSYRLWSDGRAGFDCTRILRWMALVIVLPIGVFTVLALPMHTALRDQDIRVCGYGWAGCRTVEYSKAVRMTLIKGFRDRDGKLHPRAGIVLDFADGRRWSSADIGDFAKSVDPALSAYLIERTGLPLEQAETEMDIPKSNSRT